ncbi:MAG: glutamyl-tRNA reductase [Gaiellaceae bacterium]
MSGARHVAVAGTSHRHEPLERRERLRLDDELASDVVRRLAADGYEAVALSTCNRTELYVAGADAQSARRRALAELRSLGAGATCFRYEDEWAARHLFRVAGGLDSLVAGETQILGQVRDAHTLALEAGATGRTLNRLFQQAIEAGRRVRTETDVARHPVSVPSVAVELAARDLGDLSGLTALVVGTGTMAHLVALNLLHRGVGRLAVAGRNPSRAAELALRLDADWLQLDDLTRALEDVDVVFSATSARDYVIAPRHVGARRRPLLLVDLAVPRDVDPAVRALAGCTVRDVDDLEGVAAAGLDRRLAEVPRAEAIVTEESRRFAVWQRELAATPAISSLRRRAEEIRTAELARAATRLAQLSPAERRSVETLTAQIVAKLLHAPTVRAREAAGRDENMYADALLHLFALNDA